MANRGFIKFLRSESTRQLMRRPKCFVLLALIAQRARRTGDLSVSELQVGEALLGDHATIGLTEQEYRTAKRTLERLGLATFMGTSRGTIARLTDTTVFDINAATDNVRSNGQATDRQRPANERVTTNKNERMRRSTKNGKKAKEYQEFRACLIRNMSIPQPTYQELRDASPSRGPTGVTPKM